uniref:M-phase inducer phosphatase n=1 Tax=Blastobotrys adeninivorans TaxID=409370 RepID=A0A060T479_BLAAD
MDLLTSPLALAPLANSPSLSSLFAPSPVPRKPRHQHSDESPLKARTRLQRIPSLPPSSSSSSSSLLSSRGSSSAFTPSNQYVHPRPDTSFNGLPPTPSASLAADLSQNFHIANTPAAPTPRRALFGPSRTLSQSGRQLKRSNASPAQRPSKFRRTQSMFENAAEVVASPDQADQMDDGPVDLGFRTFSANGDPFPRIDRDTLCELMDGRYGYDRVLVIDCRFEYEYSGGHIDGAININSKDSLEQVLLKETPAPGSKTLLVFHCEYSAHRGPRMAMHLRSLDRSINAHRYPALHYPHLVVLAGGYSQFFQAFRNRCVPQCYVEMNDEQHRVACEREMSKFRKNMSLYGDRALKEFRFPDKDTPSRQKLFA